jgi:hypothetical protein
MATCCCCGLTIQLDEGYTTVGRCTNKFCEWFNQPVMIVESKEAQ